MSVEPGLFPEPERLPGPPEPEPDPRTAGQRRRDRMAEAIGRGQHPLSVPLRTTIPLHPEVPRKIAPKIGPTCGTCVHRQHQNGGNRDYPKCMIEDGTRATRGESTDVRASWPGCNQWET